jgi:hypothetical protein
LNFVQAVQASDLDRFGEAFMALHDQDLWKRVSWRVQGLNPTKKFRRSFLPIWERGGGSLRSQVNDDLSLVRLLRVLLPAHTGSSLRLYRGESFFNRQRRTYGLSWSSDRDVAWQHAETGICREFDGGSVLLATNAPADAIVCSLIDDRFVEMEYTVDRQRLRSVEVLERFPHKLTE